MIIQELYDKVTLANPCRQADFLTHYDTSVRAILARYGTKYVLLPGTVYVRPTGLHDDSPVFEEYMSALYDNILFLLTGNTDRKTDYVQEADDAYKTVWKRLIRGKRFVDEDYRRYEIVIPPAPPKPQSRTAHINQSVVWSENIFTKDGATLGYAFHLISDPAVTQGYMISKYYKLRGSPKIRFSYYRGPEPWASTFIEFVLYDEQKHPLSEFTAPVTITSDNETYAGEVNATGAAYFRMSCQSSFTPSELKLQTQIKKYE